ncbi:unnamed protein product, partial [Coregonus sp. 'balchen']
MEESGGRPRYPKQGGRERGAVANEAEAWRNQDAGRGYSPKPERSGQGKRGRPKKGVMGPLSSSPGGGVFKGGQSPSQREGFQRPRYPESQQVEGLVEGREENWRERPSQRWRRTSQGEDPGEDREQGRRDNTDNTPHSSGEEDRGPVVDESSLSAKELLGLKQAEEKIGREEIFRLKKVRRPSGGEYRVTPLPSFSIPNVLLDSVSEAHRHVKDKWHKRRAKERREEAVLTDLAPPGVEQVVAVSVALEGVVRERGMSDQDVENRRQIVSNMQEVLMSVLPEVKLRLYGSSCTKFGFKDSDVNIDIQFPPHAPLVFQRPVSPPAVGLLWVEMLRFYSLEFNMAECVISVRTSLVLSREAKDWPKKRIAVEDPFAVKRNVARTLNSQQMYEYILHCLKSTYKYFALPLRLPSANHTTAEPRGANHKPGPGHKAPSDVGLVQSGLSGLILESQATTKQKGEADVQDSDCMEEEEESPPESDQEKEEEDLGKNSLVTTEDEELFPLDEVSGEEQLSDEEGPDLDTPGSLDEEDEVAPPTVPEDPPKQEAPDNRTEGASVLCYGFTRQAFTRGRSHTVVCGVCKRDGHLKKDCPEDFQRVQLAPLPPMTPAFLKTLNAVCQQCYRDFALDEVEVGVREHILLDLESFVKRQFTGQKSHNKPERWQQRNMECVGSLWLGLLQFYTETFDFREHVISIRQRAALTTFNKQWTSKYIVIEDPFDLNHNLGAGLSRRIISGCPSQEFFFDPEGDRWRRQEEKRCCFLCGSNAHIKKDCPQYRGPAGSLASRHMGRSDPSGPKTRERGGERRRRQRSTSGFYSTPSELWTKPPVHQPESRTPET